MNRKPTTNAELRERRHIRVRAKVSGTQERPRLAVFRSNRFVSAQLINDVNGTTLAASHGREFKGSQSVQATSVGEAIAKKAQAKGVKAVVFDRGGFRYAGQVKAVAEAARAAGLTF